MTLNSETSGTGPGNFKIEIEIDQSQENDLEATDHEWVNELIEFKKDTTNCEPEDNEVDGILMSEFFQPPDAGISTKPEDNHALNDYRNNGKNSKDKIFLNNEENGSSSSSSSCSCSCSSSDLDEFNRPTITMPQPPPISRKLKFEIETLYCRIKREKLKKCKIKQLEEKELLKKSQETKQHSKSIKRVSDHGKSGFDNGIETYSSFKRIQLRQLEKKELLKKSQETKHHSKSVKSVFDNGKSGFDNRIETYSSIKRKQRQKRRKLKQLEKKELLKKSQLTKQRSKSVKISGPFKCIYCKETNQYFPKLRNLNRHIKKRHTRTGKGYQCDFGNCRRTFATNRRKNII